MENTAKHTSSPLTLGILAHVDAGKTTLSEAMLYLTGSIRKLGRVDHRDAFLDTEELEKARGITIFSKQAEFSLEGRDVTLLDTPGHADFSPEMERTLQVLDCAVLVISGADGVQGQVYTLWKLLKRYGIPVLLFVNKMDQPGTDRQNLLKELQEKLDPRCMDFGADLTAEEQQEELAVCSEKLLERYLEGDAVTAEDIRRLVENREVFPCYFGSALKLEGVRELLEGLEQYGPRREYPDAFGARVFKISRDARGERLAWMKITGGSLRVKALLSGGGEAPWEEKVNQIRIYSGGSYRLEQQAEAGRICAVSGLSRVRAGEGLGSEPAGEPGLLEPVLTYRLILPEDTDPKKAMEALESLEEEEPMLRAARDPETGEISVRVMGQVQMEILQQLLKVRYGLRAEFGAGSIIYKETIFCTAEGVGHFEPLRHYAEVHLLLEPGEPGSGLVFGSRCREDDLDGNWQRLILKHLEEKKHRGVLTGSEITDMKITLLTGRAHTKHTEGGDFRQAAWRAVRQGLMEAGCVLLEPVYAFRLELPAENLGRAISDFQRMGGATEPPESDGTRAILTGSVPAASLGNYQEELTGYTRGQGRLVCTLRGYEPCHNAEEVIREKGYDPELDPENPCGSVFCSHGAGVIVPWDQVRDHMHVDSGWRQEKKENQAEKRDSRTGKKQPEEKADFREAARAYEASEKELREIFERTYRTGEREEARDRRGWRRPARREGAPSGENAFSPRRRKPVEEYLLVDGYNIIFAWEELRDLAEANIDAARDKLMDILCNYQGTRPGTLILVFDAYKVPGGPGEVNRYHNIFVVYTKEAETADQYIEKTVRKIGQQHRVRVATSDALEQVIILGGGARRVSAREFREEIRESQRELRESYLEKSEGGGRRLFEEVPDELAGKLEDIRLGKEE
ncbi:MAG TPA: TetM/TetW/TetO/TetS family tetracycline resistance ribosomal protection protein [Candidatus Scatomonas pullistercoris]|uniref:TetM/TetW/TetO/TetS family tetracycline resistance ribosomal protection protein n=1 Tax=Candidatus Scatomonas pullistercoris TaxID=2840920 RepID=A0A9D1P500_9FIRM|nr:TetM/TetW/TetO/TetS family tetracycline resistance ribosomal protection protein [Candidatus Scatomonas pullistercoris]